MKNFLNKIILFSLPIILFLFVPSLYFFINKEYFYNIDNLIQGMDEYKIGYLYNENNYKYLKWKVIDESKPFKIWTIGSSRVLQFRKIMFDSSFYNAGYTIKSVVDFLPFIQSFPNNKLPNILIIGLDQWMFNKNWDDLSNNDKPIDFWKNSFSFFPNSKILFSFYSNILNNSTNINVYDPIKNYFKSNLVGINANMHYSGFRRDGSFSYGDQITKKLRGDKTFYDFEFNETMDRVVKGERKFQFCEYVNKRAINELEKLLIFTKKKGIYVIGFLPPFANKVNEKIEKQNKHQYMRQIYSEIETRFRTKKYEIYDFTKLDKINAKDDEMIDGFHSGEIVNLKMLIYMLNNNSNISKYTSIEKISLLINNKRNRYEIN